MPIDGTKLTALLALIASGRTPQIAEYIKVQWSESVTSYYGTAAYNNLGGYIGIGHVIEPRIIPKSKTDPFFEYEICPDLRTDNISITFDDIDKDITGKFQTYSSGVACFFYLYYPDVDLTIEMWSGQLQAPELYGWKTVKATATNGFRSRELLIPGRTRRTECTAQIFAGKLPPGYARLSSLCDYDPANGRGHYKTGTTEYDDCPKTPEACIIRLGDRRSFGGFQTRAEAVNYPYQGHPFLAMGRGNAANTDPIRVVFGTKNVHGLQPLLYRLESPPHTTNAVVAVLWEVCEGPIVRYGGFLVNQTDYSAPNHANDFNLRLGTRGQTATSFGDANANFSSTALVLTVYGGGGVEHIGLESDNFEISSLTAQCSIQGFSEVCVYTDPDTFTRIWSDDRVFCLLELLRNQKFGVGYPDTKFTIADWITVSDWSNETVGFTALFPDGESLPFNSRRSSFNAILEGKPMAEQVEDICRSGAISVPFLFESELTINAFRAATTDELTDARVFTDTGQAKNIVWDDGQPALELAQIPDNKVVNEVELRFEDVGTGGIERALTVDDPDQKLKAGRQLGPDYFLSVPKKFTGVGIDNFAEALRGAYRLLKYGQFDEGGTDNNLKVVIKVALEQALGVKRYDVIKIVSSLLDNFDLPSGVLTDTSRYPVQYFRVLKLKKVAGNRCEITAQVYNHNSYTHFETTPVGDPHPTIMTALEAGTIATRGRYQYIGMDEGKASFQMDTFTVEWTGVLWNVLGPAGSYYTSTDDTDLPSDATFIVGVHGAAPPIVFVEGTVPTRPARELTIGTPVVDASTGLVTVEVGS